MEFRKKHTKSQLQEKIMCPLETNKFVDQANAVEDGVTRNSVLNNIKKITHSSTKSARKVLNNFFPPFLCELFVARMNE